MIDHKCKVCNVELNGVNWYSSNQKVRNYICKKCAINRKRLWREANPEKHRAQSIRANRKNGARPFGENRECSSFLGVHVAERVLSKVFNNIERMPYGNPGYDFVCNHGKLIDVKSACSRKDGTGWQFNINRNTTANYFLCLAFDNRENLTPLHAWLIPGNKLNHLIGARIRPNTIHKWDAYKFCITKISTCCNAMR